MNLWNFHASFYNFLHSLPWIKTLYKKELENLKNLLESIALPKTILDLGTGTGSSLSLFPAGVNIICLDQSYAMLRKIDALNSLLKIYSDACSLPVKKESIHFIAAVGLLEYVKNKSNFLHQVKSCLAPNRYLLITIAHPCFLNLLRTFTGHSIHTISRDKWEALCNQHGFHCLGKKQSTLQTQYLLQKTFSP